MRDKVALGTGQGTKMDVFSKNFQGGGGGGGGRVISNPKIYVASFRPLYRFFWPFSEKMQHYFLNMMGGQRPFDFFSENSSILVP